MLPKQKPLQLVAGVLLELAVGVGLALALSADATKDFSQNQAPLPRRAVGAPAGDLSLVLTWGSLKVRPHDSLDDVDTASAKPVQSKTNSKFILSASRNEFETLQLVLRGPATAITGVRFWFGPGLVAAMRPPTLYRVDYINVTRPTDCYSGGAGLWPEHLIPDVDTIDGQKRNAFPFSIPFMKLRSVFADILIPPDQPFGNFSASVDVLGSGGRIIASDNFTIEVFNATMPSTPSLRTLFGLWPLSGLLAAHNVSQNCCVGCFGNKVCCCPNNTAATDLVKKYLRAGLNNRVSLSALDVMMPLPGPGGALPPADEWARFFATWAEFLPSNAKLKPRRVGRHPRTIGLDGDDAVLHRNTRQNLLLAGGTTTVVEVPCNWGALGLKAPCRLCDGMTPQYLAALVTEFHQRGLSDLLVFGAHDEPHSVEDWAQIRGQAAFLRKAKEDPHWPSVANQPHPANLRVMSTTDIGTAALMNSSGEVGTYCPMVQRLSVKSGPVNCSVRTPGGWLGCGASPSHAGASVVQVNCGCYPPSGLNMQCDPSLQPPDKVRERYPENVSLWWYQACASWGCQYGWALNCPFGAECSMGWPSIAIDHDGVRNRVMEWASWLENIDGELYWDSIFAYPNPDQADPSSWGGKLRPDPWSRQTPTGLNAGGSGDGNLFSPGLPSLIGGSTSIPVESVRLKMIRDGIEDNELLRIAERRLGRSEVVAMVRPFIRNAWDFEAREHSVMQTVRQLIGRRLTGHRGDEVDEVSW